MLTEKQKYAMLAFGLALLGSGIMFSALLPTFASLSMVMAAAVAVFFCLSKESRKKPTLWYAAGIALICLPLLDSKADLLEIVNAMLRFAPVMLLLVGIAHFRHSVARSGLSAAISRQLIVPADGSKNSVRVSLLTTVLTIFSGQGAIAIVCTALNQKIKDKLAIAKITNRALCASMYVLPTTIAAASVASAIPRLDIAAVAMFGIPLTVWALAGSMVPRLEILAAVVNAPVVEPKHPVMLAAFFVIACILFYYVTRQMTLAFGYAMVASYLFETLVFSKKNLVQTARTEGAKSLDTIMPELFLLAASGLLIFTVEGIDLLSHVSPAAMEFISNKYSVLLFLIVVLPLITVAGVHPLILFGIFFSLVTPPIFEQTHLRYLAWTSMFVMANLLSPVSICSIVAATSIQATSRETSYVSHWKFCAGLMIFTFFYLSWLARFH